MLSQFVFWSGAAVVCYTYLGYPAMIWLLAKLSPRPVRKAAVTPTISVLIAAHNEERLIGKKIENCLALSYPPERLDIIVVSDGSTDRTARIVEECASRAPGRVKLVSLSNRQGKPVALNVGALSTSAQILLLADSRQRLDPEVAHALARNFADPTVGAVSGQLTLKPSGGAENGRGLGLYWRYEKAIRQAEGRAGSSIGFTGAVSAIRRELFTDVPADALVDDLVIPLRVIARGYRVVFEPMAEATDSILPLRGQEFSRKVRTLAGVAQTLLELPRWIGPLPALARWQLVSHKALRLVVPYALAAVFGASLCLEGRLYRTALLVQACAYGLGFVGLLAPHRGWLGRVTSVPATFVMLNWAAVVGPLLYLSGRRLELWHASRSKETTEARSS